MSSVEAVLRSFQLLESEVALEIAKEIASPDAPPADGYAASSRSPQAPAQTLAGLRLPTTSPDPADQATLQSLIKNIVTTNPGIAQTTLSTMVLATMVQTPAALPSDVASQQGFTKEDAAQMAATSLPTHRLQNGVMSPLRQVAGGASRSELWDGSKAPPAADHQPELAHQKEQGLALTKRDDVNDLQNAMTASSSAQAEHTGIIPSFILNAAMLPGWPVPNQAAMAEFVAKTKMSEEEMLKYLANLGASDELIEKFRKKKSQAGKKILVYLAILLTAVETVIGTVADELALLSGEEKNLKESRERANPRGYNGSRQHVYIE
jgi:hypothetical protein